MDQSKKFTVVVSGPKDVLKSPIQKRTSGKHSFRHFLNGHVRPGQLVGLRVIRTCGGNPKEAVTLDIKIKNFVEQKYTKEVSVYRAKLIRPFLKTGRKETIGRGSPEPEVITLDDDCEVFGDVDPNLVAGEGGGGVDMAAFKAEEEREDPVVVEDSVAVDADDSGVDVSAPLGDEQQPTSGQQISEEGTTAAPAPQPPVTIKQEKKITIKTEIPEPPESTIADMRARGVKIENLETLTRRKIKNFSNPFLLTLREEVRKLRKDSYTWQSIVGKAPRCAYLIDELFK